MSTDNDTLVGSRPLLVLFADISGSTRLFEDHGDAVARDACAACVAVMTEVVERFDGTVVKTIGDEIMAVFDDPAKGVMASTDLQGAVRRAGEEGRFVTGELRIKVGLHFGLALEEVDDTVGEASIVAQQVIKLAKADQVLTTDATLEAIPPMLRSSSRFQDRIDSAATGETLEVHELIWEVSGLTQMANVALPGRRAEHTRLVLTRGGQSFTCDAGEPTLTIGRVQGNDVVVPGDLTSREHASVQYRRGRFYIADNSANGTLVIGEDGSTTSLRREEFALRGSGRLCVGGSPEKHPEGVSEFRCEWPGAGLAVSTGSTPTRRRRGRWPARRSPSARCCACRETSGACPEQ